MKIKKGDTILVIKGKDRGKTGKVERVWPQKDKVLITGVNIYKKHLKPSRRYPHGGIVDVNMPLELCNVMMICCHCNQPTRVGFKQTKEEKLRICKICQESVDVKA